LIAELDAWHDFYVIVGSSAAALIGLQFVVIALVADAGAPTTKHSASAFGTPTIVHFSAALLTAAIISAPWQTLVRPSLAIAASGAAGLGYTLLVLKRVHRQTDYAPVLEDWMWHTALPFVAYAALLVDGILLPGDPETCLFIVGGSALLLLFIGIHNAWDAVLYFVVDRRQREKPESPKST
jgi:hypothetical protein